MRGRAGQCTRVRNRGGKKHTIGRGCAELQRGIYKEPRGGGGGEEKKQGSDKVWNLQYTKWLIWRSGVCPLQYAPGQH